MIPADKKLAMTVYFVKETGSLLMTANIFGIALSTASKIIHEVCKAITEHFGSKYIRLPRMEEEMIQKASEFESRYGMTQAFGCIDGTHVPILRPQIHQQNTSINTSRSSRNWTLSYR